MSFANINLGVTAGDHSGDSLRVAFDKVNRNFYQVSLVDGNLTAGVYSINARSGNVTLTINDIPGAVSIGNVSTIVQNNLTNYANLTYVNSLLPNVTAIGTQISTAIAAEDLASIRGQISSLQSSQYSRDVDVDNLQLGNILLTSRVSAGNAVVVSANTAMKSYVDAQTSTVTTAWTANAGAQANQIAGANAAITTANTAMKNYVDAGTYGWEAGNTALKAYTDYQITTANTALNSYVDTRFTTLTGGASTALDTLLEIGTALGNNASFSGVMVTWLGNLDSKITGSNSAIVTANTALKSYVDGQISTTQSWVTGANAAIVSANTAMKSYADAQDSAVTTAWTANAASQAGLITTLTSNAGVQADAISSLQSNAASQAGLITTLTSNAGAQADAISSLQSNAGVQADAISVLQGNIVTITTTLIANVAANALTQHNSIVSLTANAGGQSDSITALTGNAGAQHNSIIGANAAIVTANTSMKSYVDAQNSTVTTAWTSNAGAQADAITALTVSRTAVVATPTVLTSNVGGNINITGFKGYALYSIGTSANTTANVWVTIYSNLAARVTDYSRLVGETPPTGTGIIAQTINVGNITQFFTPAVYGFNNENTANTNIPLKATVTSADTANVTITVTMLKLEN